MYSIQTTVDLCFHIQINVQVQVFSRRFGVGHTAML